MSAESRSTESPRNGVVDVSGLPTTRVQNAQTAGDVYFERKGGRTFLVPQSWTALTSS